MARTYLSGDNSRGGEVTAMGGSVAHFRGWNVGVRVAARHRNDDRDRFAVYMTGGSGGAGGDKLLGHVTETADGPVWEDFSGESILLELAALDEALEGDDAPEILASLAEAAREVVGDHRPQEEEAEW